MTEILVYYQLSDISPLVSHRKRYWEESLIYPTYIAAHVCDNQCAITFM